jgi:2-dehydro-3-deoxy-D-arabinonate dehydratase
MRLCRFQIAAGEIRAGCLDRDQLLDLTALGLDSLTTVLEASDPFRTLESWVQRNPPIVTSPVRYHTPIERQEVWAAGVTYLRSKTARMEESDFSANAYDRVYEAARPELFFKALPEKVCGPGERVGIRRDARWNVPEPELVLVFNSRAELAGYSIGNDMSSRDIEGENLLYLPQAKVYDRSCAVGPAIAVGALEQEVRGWPIEIQIRRASAPVFEGSTTVAKIKRSFAELGEYLFRSQTFPHGAALLTGTGVVPPDDFTLQPGDEINIHIPGVGRLNNIVDVV